MAHDNKPTPSFPRRRETTGRQGVRHTGFKAVSTGRGGNKPNQPPLFPPSLDGRGPKPVPVPDTGAEGENDASASLYMERNKLHPDLHPTSGFQIESRITIWVGMNVYALSAVLHETRCRAASFP